MRVERVNIDADRRVPLRAVLVFLLTIACAPAPAPEPEPEPESEPLALPARPDAMEPAVASRVSEAESAVTRAPDDGALWGRLAAVYDANDHPRPAREAYERAMQLQPDEWRWAYLASRLDGSTDGASRLDLLERAAASDPPHAPLHERLGLARFRAGDRDGAERAMARATELEPDRVNPALVRVRAALARDDAETAWTVIEPLVLANQAEGTVFAQLSAVLEALGRDDEAAAAARQAAISPSPAAPDGWVPTEDPWIDGLHAEEGVSSLRWIERAAWALATGELDDAEAAVGAAREAAPNDATVHLLASRIALARQDSAAARSRLDRAMELDADNARVWFVEGRLRELAGDGSGAQEAYRRTLELDPRNSEARQRLALRLQEAGRFGEVVDLLQEAQTDRPEDPALGLQLANALVRTGREAEALDVLARVREWWPDDVEVLDMQAITWARQGRLDEAIPGFRAVIARDPSRVRAYSDLTNALWRQRRHGEAIRALRAGLAAAPEHPGLTRRLAWTLATCPDEAQRRGAEALRLAEALNASTGGGSPEHLDTLAAALAETGNFRAAAATQRRAIEVLQRALASGRVPAAQRSRLEATLPRLFSRLAGYESERPYRDG